MNIRRPACRCVPRLLLLAASLFLLPDAVGAAALEPAETLFAKNCAVCHGADRGGCIGPALNRDSLRRLSEAAIAAKVVTGSVGTLMPSHPIFFGKLSKSEIASIAALVKNEPAIALAWSIDDIRASVTTLSGGMARRMSAPFYDIADMDDLMAVMGRGRYAAGEDPKIIFIDGRTNRRVGEVPTEYAPHLNAYHPLEPRWAYALTDAGYLFKIDLCSLKAVKRARIGFNSASLALSRDGRFVAAGSFIPNSAVIPDADSLQPLKYFELRGIDPEGQMVESEWDLFTDPPLPTTLPSP